MSLRLKLLLSQVPLVVALIFVSIVAISNVSSLSWHSEAILKDNYRSVLAAQRMRDAIERLDHLTATLALGSPIAPPAADASRLRRAFENELRVQEGNITEDGEIEATRGLRRAWTEYEAKLDPFLEATQASSDDRARWFREDLEPAFAAAREAVDAVLTINLDAIVHKSERARQVAERSSLITIFVGLAAVLLGALGSILLTSRMLVPLGLLTRTVQHIGEGDFETRVDVSGNDEIARLAGTINRMAARLSEYRHSSLGELLLAQQASQAAIDSLPDPVIVFDVHRAILNVNQAAESLPGLVAGHLTALPADLQGAIERACEQVLQGRGGYQTRGFEDAVMLPSSEGEKYFLVRATPLAGEDGGISGVTVVLQDVTRTRLIEDLRNDLVATVAHELRTPLTSLRMALYMSLEQAAGALNEKQADLLYTAREDCERLQTIVDELLDVARLQSGRIELDIRPFVVADLISDALSVNRQAAEDRRLDLRSMVLPGLPPVQVDRERFQRVLSNLIINAIRHTPPGGFIELRAKELGAAVRFEVIDSGPGIPLEHRARIFEKFTRVPGSDGGSVGLGLSIAKEIVEAHGGSIGVDETPGGGATFWFTLPVSAEESRRVV